MCVTDLKQKANFHRLRTKILLQGSKLLFMLMASNIMTELTRVLSIANNLTKNSADVKLNPFLKQLCKSILALTSKFSL